MSNLLIGRLHWERRGRYLDLCDGDDLLGSIETRRRRKGPSTYHWCVTRPSSPLLGMAMTLDAAKRAVLFYI